MNWLAGKIHCKTCLAQSYVHIQHFWLGKKQTRHWHFHFGGKSTCVAALHLVCIFCWNMLWVVTCNVLYKSLVYDTCHFNTFTGVKQSSLITGKNAIHIIMWQYISWTLGGLPIGTQIFSVNELSSNLHILCRVT